MHIFAKICINLKKNEIWNICVEFEAADFEYCGSWVRSHRTHNERVGVCNERVGVCNERVGVCNERAGVCNERVWVLYLSRICGSSYCKSWSVLILSIITKIIIMNTVKARNTGVFGEKKKLIQICCFIVYHC